MSARIAKIAEGIYIGNEQAVNADTLATEKITAVINLCGYTVLAPEGIRMVERILPNQELLEAEFEKTIMRLTTVSNEIQKLRATGARVLLLDTDGKSASALAAGHYMITHMGINHNDAIEKLETIYMSKEQKAALMLDRQYEMSMNADLPEEEFVKVQAKWQAASAGRNERRELCALTLSSFKRVLRVVGTMKK